jgi:hypothetical protein
LYSAIDVVTDVDEEDDAVAIPVEDGEEKSDLIFAILIILVFKTLRSAIIVMDQDSRDTRV